MPNSFLNPTPLLGSLALFPPIFKGPLLSHLLPFLPLLLAFKQRGQQPPPRNLVYSLPLKATSFTKPVRAASVSVVLQSGFPPQSAFGTGLSMIVWLPIYTYLYN